MMQADFDSYVLMRSLSIFLRSSLFEEEGAIQREGRESEVREPYLGWFTYLKETPETALA